MNTEEFSGELRDSINHAITAHSKHPKTSNDAIRFWDKTTPYAIHPIWCAMTLLTETTLPENIRYNGYQALLWHDTLEDTTLSLPTDIKPEVKLLIEEMTFESFEQEMADIWGKSDTAKLLKLYDKVSNLLDGVWMKGQKLKQMKEHTRQLTGFVENVYGELNIVKFSKAICEATISHEEL